MSDFPDVPSKTPVMGRPRAEIDLDVVREAAGIGCTIEEIAVVTKVSKETFYQHLKINPALQQAVDEGRENGRTTLRRLQWHGAQDKNPTMLIWLGKQLLGQKDKHEVGGPDGGPMVVQIVNFTDGGDDPTPS